MPSRRCLLLALLVVYAPVAWSQEEEEDDLLAPLTPADPKAPKRPKRKKPVQPREDDGAGGRLLVKLPDASLKNARLFVDDKEVGVLPQEAVELAPGEHRVSVKRLGYAPYNATVRVKDSGVTEVAAALEPLAGVLSVTSETVGVEVFVDGKSYGPVPVNDVVLAPGEHQVRFKRDGYEDQTQALNVKAGKDYALKATLRATGVARTDRPERGPKLEPRTGAGPAAAGSGAVAGVEREREGGTPWYGQWYVWAGGAAVVAAGAGAATYFATRPTSPCGAVDCDACINKPNGLPPDFCDGNASLRRAPLRVPIMVGFGGSIGK